MCRERAELEDTEQREITEVSAPAQLWDPKDASHGKLV